MKLHFAISVLVLTASYPILANDTPKSVDETPLTNEAKDEDRSLYSTSGPRDYSDYDGVSE